MADDAFFQVLVGTHLLFMAVLAAFCTHDLIERYAYKENYWREGGSIWFDWFCLAVSVSSGVWTAWNF